MRPGSTSWPLLTLEKHNWELPACEEATRLAPGPPPDVKARNLDQAVRYESDLPRISPLAGLAFLSLAPALLSSRRGVILRLRQGIHRWFKVKLETAPPPILIPTGDGPALLLSSPAQIIGDTLTTNLSSAEHQPAESLLRRRVQSNRMLDGG